MILSETAKETQQSDNNVFDVREIFNPGKLQRKAKTIDLNMINIRSDEFAQNGIANDKLRIKEFENDDYAVNLDPILDISNFFNYDDEEFVQNNSEIGKIQLPGSNISINDIEEGLEDNLTFSLNRKASLTIPKKPNVSVSDDSYQLKPDSDHIGRNLSNRKPILSKQTGPQKAKLIRDGKAIDIQGGLDFANAVFDEEMGKRCIEKQEMIETIEKTPILECKHR